MGETRARWTVGAAVAVTIGVGAAFAASMGAVGYAFGALVGVVLLAAGNARR